MSSSLPHFSNLDLSQFTVHLDQQLQTNLTKIERLVKQPGAFTWDNLMYPLECMEDELERTWSPLAHLHAVVNTPELRQCYQACLPKLSAYETAIGQNQTLYNAMMSIEQDILNLTQKKIITDALRNFRLSGVALDKTKKQRYEEIVARLAELANQFETNVLDATNAYELHVEDEQRLAGLPEHAVVAARTLAADKGCEGWIFNLEYPCYHAIATYADDRSLREELYYAYVTRASDQGPSAGKYDNTAIMNEILALRHELANLLDFANYADYSLATKMAESPSDVNRFLHDLVKRAHPQGAAEFHALCEFASPVLAKLEPWDIAYFSEKKQQAHYAISQEELRPYFPLSRVVNGLLTILKRLYGVSLIEVADVNTWHPDVRCYRVVDELAQARGYVYMDLFARPHKRGGAWMDSLQSRFKHSDGWIQLPIATLTCNFAKPMGTQPPTLSHDELVTFFHEFGHCLQHLLTQVDYISAAGIQGVEWDAVELPSQFFENWCWADEAIALLSSHVTTGEPLPHSLFTGLFAAKNFQSAMAMLRQLEFALFDFGIHENYQSQPDFITKTLANVRQEVAVVPVASFNRFQHSFTHIFGGGYAAGYYSYKWAEVLSSDAFVRFEEEGIFSTQAGQDFLQCILETGSSRKASEAYFAFRGQEPTIDALLRHNGIQG